MQAVQIVADHECSAILTSSSQVFVCGRALAQDEYQLATVQAMKRESVVSVTIQDHSTPTELPVMVHALRALAEAAAAVATVARNQPHPGTRSRAPSPLRTRSFKHLEDASEVGEVGHMAVTQLRTHMAGCGFETPFPGRLHISSIDIGCYGATLMLGISRTVWTHASRGSRGHV